jgi:coenzyme F420-reducing hydrogenase beta subunit
MNPLSGQTGFASAATQPRRQTGESIRQIVAAGACIGCGACAVASRAYETTFTRYRLFQAVTNSPPNLEDEEAAVAVCPFSATAENEDEIAARIFPNAVNRHRAVGSWATAYVGAVTEGAFRKNGSSGGLVSWTLHELFRLNLIDGVVHVRETQPEGSDRRLFEFQVSSDIEGVLRGAKSRYYPVEFSRALTYVRDTPGRYAFVGVPCFIKAVRLLQREDPVLRERVTVTLGLFCGHLKSAALVDSFAQQSGMAPGDVTQVNFRVKQEERRADVYTAGLTPRHGPEIKRDWFEMVDGDWGMGFFQYSACNYCDDVMAETADVSFGDAWVAPYSADGRGTNVVVVRNAALDGLFREGAVAKRIEIDPIDGDFLARTQAAGLRQRREGLAYRLHLRRSRFTPRKRVVADRLGGGWKRRLIYRLRRSISHWSHPIFLWTGRIGLPSLYRAWARTMRILYRGIYWCDRGPVVQRIAKKFRGRFRR